MCTHRCLAEILASSFCIVANIDGLKVTIPDRSSVCGIELVEINDFSKGTGCELVVVVEVYLHLSLVLAVLKTTAVVDTAGSLSESDMSLALNVDSSADGFSSLGSTSVVPC